MRLTRARAADFALLPQWFAGPRELAQWAGPGVAWPLSAERLTAMIDATERAEPVRRAFAGRDGDVTVAHGQLVFERDQGVARLTYLAVAPAARGRGYGAALVLGLTRRAFAVAGIERAELNVYGGNHAARRLYRQCGFLEEGVRRAAVPFDGGREDVVIMGQLRAEAVRLVGSRDG
jgi:RimJ/RimL family protein N-acetyltransferase